MSKRLINYISDYEANSIPLVPTHALMMILIVFFCSKIFVGHNGLHFWLALGLIVPGHCRPYPNSEKHQASACTSWVSTRNRLIGKPSRIHDYRHPAFGKVQDANHPLGKPGGTAQIGGQAK